MTGLQKLKELLDANKIENENDGYNGYVVCNESKIYLYDMMNEDLYMDGLLDKEERKKGKCTKIISYKEAFERIKYCIKNKTNEYKWR